LLVERRRGICLAVLRNWLGASIVKGDIGAKSNDGAKLKAMKLPA
jgi:hypothetical protein